MADEDQPKVGEWWFRQWDLLFGGVEKVQIVCVAGDKIVVRRGRYGDLFTANRKQLIAKSKAWWRFWE